MNLSDLAAKGAAPRGFLVSLAIAADTRDWTGCAVLQRFARRQRNVQMSFARRRHRSHAGTDDDLGFMFGSVPTGTMVRRAGAKPGDRIFVTGTIGDAALGLQFRRGANWKLDDIRREHLLSRYRLPHPRTALAEVIRTYASAAMDVSDGLVGDLTKLSRVSGVAATAEVGRVPLSGAARAVIGRDPAMREIAFTGGDDYELLCTVPPDRVAAFRAAAQAAKTEVTEIGEIASGQGARFVDETGRVLAFKQASFSAFLVCVERLSAAREAGADEWRVPATATDMGGIGAL